MTRARIPLTTTLLYWLALVCGLAGITFLRLGTPEASALPALWCGAISGVAVGQILGWARLRAWVPAIAVLGACWLAPAFLLLVSGFFGSHVDLFGIVLSAATVCGFLSRSERAGLVAFWLPTVLWMVLVLDTAGAATTRQTVAPFVACLGALFIAYFRARETRRVALWTTYASARLATPVSRTVLHAPPVRSVLPVVWSAAIGVSAVALTVWVAPHLWQKDREQSQAQYARSVAEQQRIDGYRRAGMYEPPCCPDPRAPEPRERVRELIPLQTTLAAEKDRLNLRMACTECRHGLPLSAYVDDTGYGYEYARVGSGSSSSSSSGTSYGSSGTGSSTAEATASYTGPSYVDPTPAPPVPAAPPLPAPPETKVEKKTDKKAPKATASHKASHATVEAPVAAAPPPPPVVTAEPTPPPPPPESVAVPPPPEKVTVAPSAPAPSPGVPWRGTLGLCAGLLALHVLVRAGRRALTLRHLTRPYWKESVDQRVSNHWQRALIGLRDAGIRPREGELPGAFARRVGVEGMSACADVLHRVHHGVRVETSELDAMGAAASRVFTAARARAGLAGRAASWLRWPLA